MWSFFARAAAALPAERAHALAIWALAKGFGPSAPPPPERLKCRVLGLDFPGPVGLAAGFDKNAEAVDAALRAGAGFVEVGAVTPRPQEGSAKPRVFRLSEDHAIVNRLGFNNDGMDAVGERLRERRGAAGVVGVNLGANANSVDRMADYETTLRHLWGLADFFTVNVSSPNTKGLRAFEGEEALRDLLGRLLTAREALSAESGVAPAPLLVKLSPDLDAAGLEAAAAVALETGIDGLVATNTTVSRPDGLKSPAARQTGGLSGRPLFEMSTAALRRLYARTEGRVTLIGVGGVETAEQAYAKLRAGASLVQLYTAMVYRGPGVFAEIHAGLDALLARDGVAAPQEIVGLDAQSDALV